MKRAAGLIVSFSIIVLAGCSAGQSVEPIASTSSAGPVFAKGLPAFDACMDLYGSDERFAPGLSPRQACDMLREDNDDETLIGAFSDPTWVENKRLELLDEVDPVKPHYRVTFAGAGSGATVTLSADGHMTQRHVKLPYSTDIDASSGYVSANVVHFGDSVGCKIVLFDNQHRDGETVDEVKPVDGQTLAQCSATR